MFVDRKTKLFIAGVWLGIALNWWFNLGPNSFGLLWEALRNPRVSQSLNEWDWLYAGLSPDENVWLQFKDFRIEDSGLVETIYFRSNYTAYPSKVLTAAPGAVLNRGEDILRSQLFAADDDWLTQNRVARIIRLEPAAGGGINANIQRRDVR